MPIGTPYARTQYRNTYSENVTRTITTFNDGYTASKHGTAFANFPAPPAGEEYVSIVRGPWINNGACYGSLSLRGFGPHAAPIVSAVRTTGSSCGNPRFTAALEVEIKTTKKTAWYYSQAQADAEHAGTSETQTVTTAKHIVSITRDSDGKKISLT